MAKILQFIPKVRSPKCAICNRPVDLETALFDIHGKAFHGDCYSRMIRLRQITRGKGLRLVDKKSLF
jgi:hypothetical protein